MKSIKVIGAGLLCGLLLAGCTTGGGENNGDTSGGIIPMQVGEYAVEYKNTDTDATVENAKTITLNGDTITFDGTSSLARVVDSSITITSGGTYIVTGTLSDGQIIVDEPGDEAVRLVLSGADITCQTASPIYVKEAKKVVLVLAEGTQNTVTDGSTYADSENDDAPNAAIFSKVDLSITGGGSLTVNANYNNGINSKDKLKITGGTLTVTAAGNGIKGKDCVAIADGHITVTAGHDGIKSSNAKDPEKGFVRIDGGTLTITAEQDGIQAQTGLVVTAGELSVTTGGGSANASTNQGGGWGFWGQSNTSGDSTSAKGLKAGVAVSVSDGSITVDSSDDAVHANGNVLISGGTLTLASGDDGIHADSVLQITAGRVTVTKSYEGLEGLEVHIDGGDIHVTATDDGLNAAGGSDGSSVNGRPGQNGFAVQEGALISITGGTLTVNADGDGLDSNNVIVMTGGTVTVWGPTSNADGAIDYERSFTMNGGTLIAAGSSGMAESITDGSVHAIFVGLANQAAGTPVTVTDSDGNEIITFTPEKAYYSLVIATPELAEGKTYTVTVGETSGTVTLSGVSTTLNLGGMVGGGMGGMGGPGGNMGGGMGGGRGPGGRGDGAVPGGNGGPGGNVSEMPDGEMPQVPDGNFPGGDVPQMPDRNFPGGDMPQMPGNNTPNVQT